MNLSKNINDPSLKILIVSTVIEIGETLMIKPTHLLDQLQSLNNRPLIKVLLGMRRVGKSNLYVLFIEQLKKQK